ncbi:hypothetical protein [Chryseobacterium shigense]|uniref:Uncharacterized protein n=1 Tax=Chryseobacterium shigense TaxID=297244 RepID=A0A841N877_9FLAO|nr:hypothetical protein [Chryseobacterium shigense]MBB6369640.1 hypothetical protein [Chryseobacterium shigense]
MKKILFTAISLGIAVQAHAQIGVNKSSVNGTSTILDFEDSPSNTKGLILPAPDNLSAALSGTPSNNNGTFLFDKSDKKVKVYENNAWKALSDEGNSSGIMNNTTAEHTSTQGIIMGAPSSSAYGVLVLESANKAMILPKIQTPHQTVKSPYPGMICYDTVSKTIAIFDGAVWNYWK